MLSTVIISIIDHTVEQAFVRYGGTCLLWQIMKMKGVKTQNDQFHVRQRKAAGFDFKKRRFSCQNGTLFQIFLKSWSLLLTF